MGSYVVSMGKAPNSIAKGIIEGACSTTHALNEKDALPAEYVTATSLLDQSHKVS